MNDSLEMKVRYLDAVLASHEDLQLQYIGNSEISCWIDVRVSRAEINGEIVDWDNEFAMYETGDTVKVYLGFAAEMPIGYEALVAPRSSLHRRRKLVQVNSVSVIDEAYKGDADEWFITFEARGAGELDRFERVAQFRIQRKMPKLKFIKVDILGNANRGGEGSTGTM